MKHVIYVDVLLFINVFVNYFLLLTTSLIMKTNVRKIRILAGAFVGGLFSLSVFLPQLNTMLSILLRAFIALTLVLITFGYKTMSFYFKHFLTLFMSTFLFAGLMSAIWIVFKTDSLVYINSAIYFDINIFVLIVSSVVCYILIFISRKFFKKTTPQSLKYDITLKNGLKTISGKALLDTGNNLTDFFTGYPVIICTANFVRCLIPEEIYDILENKRIDLITDEEWRKKVRLINYSTVSSKSTMIAFRPDKVILKDFNNNYETDEVYVAVNTSQKYINEIFDALLNGAIFERGKNE